MSPLLVPPSQFFREIEVGKKEKSDNVDVSLSSSISGFGLVGQARKSETDIKDRLFLFIFISLGSTVYIYLYNS